ncbi:hypothetical protein L9F63_015185, partial [Diploptera punctata]
DFSILVASNAYTILFVVSASVLMLGLPGTIVICCYTFNAILTNDVAYKLFTGTSLMACLIFALSKIILYFILLMFLEFIDIRPLLNSPPTLKVKPF